MNECYSFSLFWQLILVCQHLRYWRWLLRFVCWNPAASYGSLGFIDHYTRSPTPIALLHIFFTPPHNQHHHHHHCHHNCCDTGALGNLAREKLTSQLCAHAYSKHDLQRAGMRTGQDAGTTKAFIWGECWRCGPWSILGLLSGTCAFLHPTSTCSFLLLPKFN